MAAVNAGTTRDKYRVIPRPKTPIQEDEIRVTSYGQIPRYVTYAARLFTEQKKTGVTIKATGNAISSAITLAEIIKRRFSDLHQVNLIGVTTISDTFEPLEEGLDEVTRERDVPFLEITLTQDASSINNKAAGYQEPIDQTLVKAMPIEEILGSRGRRGVGGRGGFRGYSAPRGRGGFRGGRGGFRGGYSNEDGGNYPSYGGNRGGRGGYRGGFRGSYGGYRGGRGAAPASTYNYQPTPQA